MTTHEEADVFPSNDVWIRRMIEADRVRRAEETRRLREAGLSRPGQPVRRVFTRPRNRGA